VQNLLGGGKILNIDAMEKEKIPKFNFCEYAKQEKLSRSGFDSKNCRQLESKQLRKSAFFIDLFQYRF
jgi:hypothetical protein